MAKRYEPKLLPSSLPGLNSRTNGVRVINALRAGEGGIVTWDELHAACWPNPITEPPSAKKIIHIVVCGLRKHGFPIKSAWGRGYYWAGRDLIALGPIAADPRATVGELILGKARRSLAA